MDYLMFNQMQDILDPGYNARREIALKKETGQGYYGPGPSRAKAF